MYIMLDDYCIKPTQFPGENLWGCCLLSFHDMDTINHSSPSTVCCARISNLGEYGNVENTRFTLNLPIALELCSFPPPD
jgi:hypothetical protein